MPDAPGRTNESIRANGTYNLIAVTVDPIDAITGDLWYRSDTNQVRAMVNGAAQTVYPGAAGGLTNMSNQRTTDSATSASTALVDVLTVTLPSAGTYYFASQLRISNATLASTPGYGIGGTSTPTAWRFLAYQSTSAQAWSDASGTSAYSAAGGTAGVSLAAAAVCVTNITGTVTVSVAGTLIIRYCRNAGTGTLTCNASSTFFASKTA